jgi:ketol-acid reductoisomerase
MTRKLPIYKTNEIAKLVGVSKNTLIRWEEEWLIPPAMRDGRGWRVWTKDALEKIIEVKKSKELINKNNVSDARLTVNIIGYGNQGTVWAKNLRDSGAYVNILLKERSDSIKLAKKDGFEVLGIEKALGNGGIFCLLIPDEEHEFFFKKYKDSINQSCLFIFAHGYSVGYTGLSFNARKALLAPKGIAKAVRFNYLEGKKTLSCFFAESSADEKTVKKLAVFLGLHPLIKTDFFKEALSDLFTEQAVLCGGVPAIILKTFNLLREQGVSEALIVQECIQELSYILDVIKKQGLYGMYKAISPLAFSGGIKVWKDIDNRLGIDEILEKAIADISSKRFIEQHSNFDRVKELEDMRERSEKFDQAINSLKGGSINVPD